jgi:hypothetical protein
MIGDTQPASRRHNSLHRTLPVTDGRSRRLADATTIARRAGTSSLIRKYLPVAPDTCPGKDAVA